MNVIFPNIIFSQLLMEQGQGMWEGEEIHILLLYLLFK